MQTYTRPVAKRGSSDLSPDDARILGLESSAITGHTLKLMVFEAGAPEFDPDALRAGVGARLDSQPRARQRVDTSGPSPRWVEADEFDIADHVRRYPVAGGDLRSAVDALMAEHLDRSRPLWTFDLIGPLADGRQAIAARIHHAMADGIAGVRFLEDVLFDLYPDPPPAGQPGVHTAGTTGRLTEIRRLPGALHRELGHRGSSSPLDRAITGSRELAFTVAPLSEMREIGAALDDPATVNDVLLAMITGGLRDWLPKGAGRLRAQIPVSLHHRDEGSGDLGNRDSFLNVDLPMGEEDPMRRLASIRAQTRVGKQSGDPQEMYDLLHALGRLPRIGAVAQRLAGSAREFSLAISNVPGPATAPVVQGRRVEHFFSSSEPGTHHALRISAISCAGEMGIGLCTDPNALPGMAALAEDIDAAFADLRHSALGV